MSFTKLSNPLPRLSNKSASSPSPISLIKTHHSHNIIPLHPLQKARIGQTRILIRRHTIPLLHNALVAHAIPPHLVARLLGGAVGDCHGEEVGAGGLLDFGGAVGAEGGEGVEVMGEMGGGREGVEEDAEGGCVFEALGAALLGRLVRRWDGVEGEGT